RRQSNPKPDILWSTWELLDKNNILETLTSVTVDQGTSYRIVTAEASTQMKTQFLGSIGFPTFEVTARGVAEESLGDAEISLVLDISGSMGSNQKMSRLRTAAQDFIDTVVLDDTLGAVSVNIVPYTAQVNAGAAIMDNLDVTRLHGFSSCVNFETEDFASTTISPTKHYTQAPHFELYSSGSGTVTNPSCPMRSYEEITAYSQNRSALKSQIGQLQDRANTSIHIGMKWGVGLLDPAFAPVVTKLIAAGKSDPAFAGRPAAFGGGALKTVILMTDGVNVNTYGIRDGAYGTPSQRYHWHENALVNWVNNNVDSDMRDDFYYVRSTSSNADSLLSNVCTAAKNKGVLVWSVGFEVSNHGASVMRSCASSDSHFFRVEGVEISEAFQSIARELNQLKLTQ
ncbi:hypothetical protein, partial [Pseudooceanicola sp.]|uniref:hypothetical protein n=1 Tax=Pseudooceanicola sp. TaxID=1914328 RepID=UPI0026016519